MHSGRRISIVVATIALGVTCSACASTNGTAGSAPIGSSTAGSSAPGPVGTGASSTATNSAAIDPAPPTPPTPAATTGSIVATPPPAPVALIPPVTTAAKPAAPTVANPVVTQQPAGPAAQSFPNCAALNAVYPHGVGRPGAVDQVRGNSKPVTTFLVDAALYAANTGRDGDNDGIACEKA